MTDIVKVICSNNNSVVHVKMGTTLTEVAGMLSVESLSHQHRLTNMVNK